MFVRSLALSFVRSSVRLYVRVYVLVARVRLSVSATTVISFLSFFLPLFLVPDRDHRTSAHTFFRSSVWECVTSCLSARAWYLILGHDTYPHEASIVCSASSSIAPPSFVPLARAHPLVFPPLSLSFSPLAFLAFPSTKSRGKKRERERVEYVLCTSRGVHHPASIVCAAGARRLFSVISIVVLTRARGCVGVCVRVCLWGVTCAQRANQDGRRFRNGDVSLPGDCGLQKAAARLRRGERRDQEVALRIRYSRLGVVDAVRQRRRRRRREIAAISLVCSTSSSSEPSLLSRILAHRSRNRLYVTSVPFPPISLPLAPFLSVFRSLAFSHAPLTIPSSSLPRSVDTARIRSLSFPTSWSCPFSSVARFSSGCTCYEHGAQRLASPRASSPVPRLLPLALSPRFSFFALSFSVSLSLFLSLPLYSRFIDVFYLLRSTESRACGHIQV